MKRAPKTYWAVMSVTQWESLAWMGVTLRQPGGMEGCVGFMAVFETQELAMKAYPNHPSMPIREVIEPKPRKRKARRAR